MTEQQPRIPGTDPTTGEPKKPALPSAKAGRAGEKVTVACKLPGGLVLRTYDWREAPVPVLGGGVKMEKVAQPTGVQVVVHGTAIGFGEERKCLMMGGYALTPNVDADFWELWLEQHKSMDVVTKHQIYALPGARIDGWAKEHAAVRTGLEPINPGSIKKPDGREMPADPRMPRGGPGISAVTTEAASPAV